MVRRGFRDPYTATRSDLERVMSEREYEYEYDPEDGINRLSRSRSVRGYGDGLFFDPDKGVIFKYDDSDRHNPLWLVWYVD